MTIDSKLRVLLVDDEPLVRRISIDILKTLWITEILEAENGENAISVMGQNEVDLLITDIQMPKMNGIELIKRIRMGRTPAERQLRTIALTTFSFTEVLATCLALGINGFLVKPITAASATEKISRALSEKPDIRPAEYYHPINSDLKVLAVEDSQTEQQDHPSVSQEKTECTESNTHTVEIYELEPGMVLLEDLHARNGSILLPSGEVLSSCLINRITELKMVIGLQSLQVRLPTK
jgi:YesN/AraC family two-component response regulator